jgi:ABC-2 type transport system permease protein
MESFGDILAYKLLSMALITFFSLLIFSSILTSLSKLYLSKDLPLVHSMPVSRGKIFLARWMESTLDSSWMVLIFSLPLFLSYGVVYKTGVFYYTMVGLISSLLSDGLKPQCPRRHGGGSFSTSRSNQRRFRFFGLLLILLLVIVFRLIRPEKFVNPESLTPFILYLRTMDSSHSPWLPTTWFLIASEPV